MGAAFDDALIKDVATVISTEARAFNNDDRAGKHCELNTKVETCRCLHCD
jgi:beta-glucosidase-like glycosyl hydrolase